MKEALKDPAADKIALIYEFDRNSPLFARVAAAELNNNNVQRALEILESGLKNFPEYPTAYFIFAKALALSGRINDAKKYVKLGTEIIECEETLENYLNEIEQIKNSVTDLSQTRRKAFFPAGVINDSNSLPVFGMKSTMERDSSADFTELAKRLSSAKMPPLSRDIVDDPFEKKIGTGEKGIISETLAGIYFTQGNLGEAKSIYEKLIITQPERADFFKQKREEIIRILGISDSSD